MCPRCRSTLLLIKDKRGIERLLILLTGKRHFRCRLCDLIYRARDRRRTLREVPEGHQSVGL